jgi:hypothetical protein
MRNQPHRPAGEQLPPDLLGVKLSLRQRLPAEDRHELMWGCAVLGGDGRTGLAEAVGAAGDAGGPRSSVRTNYPAPWSCAAA